MKQCVIRLGMLMFISATTGICDGASLQLLDPNQESSRGTTAALTVVSTDTALSDGWRFFQASGSIGSGDGNGTMRFLMYIDTPGSVLIDDLSIVAGTTAAVGYNYVANGDFESPLTQGLTNSWRIGTNCYGNSLIVDDLVHSGTGAFAIIGTNGAGAANPPTYNKSIFQLLSPAPAVNSTNTLSFWYLGGEVGTNSHLLVRVRNSAALTTGGTGIPITNHVSPTIVKQPQNQTRFAGETVDFTVVALGSAPLNYQWRKNGVDLPGATAATLTLNFITAADSDCYSVVVWNSLGSIESQWACLTVLGDGWRFFQATGSIGPGDGNGTMRFLMYIDTPGSVLVDDISIVAGTNAGVGYNYVANGDFESPLTLGLTNSWRIGTNCYGNSLIVDDLVHAGTGAFAIIGTNSAGQPNPPTYNKIIFQWLSPAPAANSTNTLSFWYFGGELATNSHLLIRVRNSAALTTGSTGIPIANHASPTIVEQPQSQTRFVGDTVDFEVVAFGSAPIIYQWRRNGVNISGATAATLTLNSVTSGNSDCYSVVVWNSVGSVESQWACLAVLADGANGTPPPRISTPTVETTPVEVNSVVFITHGWQPKHRYPLSPPPMPDWVTDLRREIDDPLRAPANWSVQTIDWLSDAWTVNPDTALDNAQTKGRLVGRLIALNPLWTHVHLIGHSAGSGLIQAAADAIHELSDGKEVHTTFLDPFLGFDDRGISWYGDNAEWADCYFTHDLSTDSFSRATGGGLQHAYNMDVSWLSPKEIFSYGDGQVAFSTHQWPYEFYLKTVRQESDPGWCPSAATFGYHLSQESGGWANRSAYPVSNHNDPNVLCGPSGAIKNPSLLRLGGRFLWDGVTRIGSAGVSVLSDWFTMDKNPAQFANAVKTDGLDDAVWFAAALPITNTVNFVQFESVFTSTNGAEGLLSVFWNTNQIGMVDERATSPGLQTYRFLLPETVTNGLYTLSFRLDSFNGTASSITVTNVMTGFAGVEQPFTLAVVGSTNRTPTLKLTGATNFNYLLQSSTNLVDWTPSALLLNTNGTVLFTDTSATNSAQRFYRALLP